MSTDKKRGKRLEFSTDPDQLKEVAERQRHFFEELAARFEGDKPLVVVQSDKPLVLDKDQKRYEIVECDKAKVIIEGHNPFVLDLHEKALLAAALRFCATTIISGDIKRKRGNPNNQRTFDHEWAAIRYELALKDGKSKSEARDEVLNLISNSQPNGDAIVDAGGFLKAIKPYCRAAKDFVNSGAIHAQDKGKE